MIEEYHIKKKDICYTDYAISLNTIGNNLPINFLIHFNISDINQIDMITISYHYYTYLSYIELED